jgi:hypothetical protein
MLEISNVWIFKFQFLANVGLTSDPAQNNAGEVPKLQTANLADSPNAL